MSISNQNQMVAMAERHARNFSQYLIYLIMASLCLSLTTDSQAQDAASQAYGAEVDIRLERTFGGVENGIFMPAPVVNGQGEASFGPFTQTSEGFNINLSGSVSVESGPLSSWASFDDSGMFVDGSGDAQDVRVMVNISQGRGTLEDTISAAMAVSESSVSGSCGNLVATASSTITNGDITVDGNTMLLPENPAPNTVIDLESMGLPGAIVILNEQFISGDGETSLSVATNAIHVIFDIQTFNERLTGDVVYGASEVEITDCALPDVADLEINLSASAATVTPGESFSYTIEAINNGPDLANGLSIFDALPDGLTINSIVPITTGVSCAQVGQDVACVADSLAVGDSMVVVITVTANAAGTIINSAEISAQSTDPDYNNNIDTISTIVEDDDADISVEMTPSASRVNIDSQLDFFIEVYNDGPATVDSFIVDDLVPSQLTIRRVTASAGINCSQSGQQVTCTGESMPAFESGFIIIETIAEELGTATNTVTVTGSNDDPDDSNNQSSSAIEIGRPVKIGY